MQTESTNIITIRTFILQIAVIIKNERKVLFIFFLYTVLVAVAGYFLPIQSYIVSIQNYGHYASIFFILAYIVRGFFYFPSVYFLIASSLIFPFPYGVVYYLLAALLSATLSHYIGVYLHKKSVFPSLKKKLAEDASIKKRIQQYGNYGVFFFHVTGISFDIPNFLSGYLGMYVIPFLIAVFFANVITVALYYTVYLCCIAPLM